MSKLFVDLSGKHDKFTITLLPTGYSTSYRLRSRVFTNYVDVNISYYDGLTKVYKSIQAPLDCNLKEEELKLKNSITDFIKITDTFEITKSQLTPDIIKKFRWCEPLIEYPEQPLPIDPYILGLWLGDGHSKCISLTSIDTPIIDYWTNYAKQNSLNITMNKKKERTTTVKENETGYLSSYRISSTHQIHHNPILIEFQKLFLINNKHIPEIFLKNSIENRIRLLAGIIDTDGYLGSNSTYEIVQKNITLSNDIVTLASSLGFFTTSIIKKGYATNTELKTVRHYNRINIYVNQINLEIPVLLERKKLKCLDKSNFHNPKIIIDNKILPEKISWNDKLDKLLIDSVDNYQSTKGKKLIPWKHIQEEVEEFNIYSHEALRARYRNLKNCVDGKLK